MGFVMKVELEASDPSSRLFMQCKLTGREIQDILVLVGASGSVPMAGRRENPEVAEVQRTFASM